MCFTVSILKVCSEESKIHAKSVLKTCIGFARICGVIGHPVSIKRMGFIEEYETQIDNCVSISYIMFSWFKIKCVHTDHTIYESKYDGDQNHH
jgi:hypothetical protein